MNPGMVVPLGSKKLEDLSRNTPEVNELFTTLLNAGQVVGAHKVTRRKQGVSFFLFISTAADAVLFKKVSETESKCNKHRTYYS
jgi:hypothetical protein